MRRNIQGAADIYVNTPYHSPDPSKRVFCPLCAYDLRDVPMIFDVRNKIWHCNYCKYDMMHHQNPIENTTLVAGNDEHSERPYMKTVDVNRKKAIKPSIYTNPAQAWNDSP